MLGWFASYAARNSSLFRTPFKCPATPQTNPTGNCMRSISGNTSSYVTPAAVMLAVLDDSFFSS